MSVTSIIKTDKEQRNVSLYSLNASEKRNVKIMVRGMTIWRLSDNLWVIKKKGKYVKKKKGLMQCSSQRFLLEGKSGPYNPFFGARYFKKGPLMYQYLSNMQKRRNSWKVKEMKMAVYLKLTWSIPLYTQ